MIRIPALMRVYGIPGVAITLLREGRTTWTAAYGYADRATIRPVTTGTYCRVESISKPVTVYAVTKLVEQGRVVLDHPVISYLKDWQFPPSKIPGRKHHRAAAAKPKFGYPVGNHRGAI